MRRKKHTRIICVFIASFLLSFLFALPRGGYLSITGLSGFQLSAFCGGVGYFAFTLYCLYRCKNEQKKGIVLFCVWLGAALIELPYRIWKFDTTLFSLPNMVVFWVGILFGYLCFLIKTPKAKIVGIVASLAIVYWASVPGFGMWLHRANFGTFTGQIEQKSIRSLVFQNETGEQVELATLKGKYVVLDFWNSSCGVCFREFPNVQSFYDELQVKYPNTATLYSVFCAVPKHDETYQTGVDILKKRGYSFPVLSLDIESPIIRQELGVSVFPTVVLLDPMGNLIFRGNVQAAKAYLFELLEQRPR